MNYGILTLLPIIIVIVIALKTKRTLEPLIVGTLVTYMIIDGFGFANGWMDAFFRVASNRDHQWVFMVCALFGSLITLLGASHGTLGFSEKLEKFCRGPKTTLIVTWIMGILIFVDDYLNIMTLSTCMKKLTDRKKIPRETLSYIIDSTGAPVCAVLPFSTWAIFFSGLFFAEAGIPELGYGSAIETFYHIIPFIFYAIAAVFIVPLFIMGVIPKVGRMRKAYNRVKDTGKVYSKESEPLNMEDEDENSLALAGNIWDFILPVGTLIALAIIGGELFLAVIAAIAVCFVLYIPRKKMSITQFCDLAMHGFCNMIPTVAIIFFAFVMQEAMTDIGIATYVINAVTPFMSAALFPAITFIIVALLNFSTGSVWGIPAIVVPIILPLALSIGANPLVVMGAVVSGATLGSHACFYSDATVLTSSCCKMENMDHALSQLPYALIAAGVSVVGYLICGFLL
ncbi:MAG: sodium:proton antiporter [Clostridiales bacterium]|nr:sodium:proton antiporter [Clostridiales bacterium]